GGNANTARDAKTARLAHGTRAHPGGRRRSGAPPARPPHTPKSKRVVRVREPVPSHQTTEKRGRRCFTKGAAVDAKQFTGILVQHVWVDTDAVFSIGIMAKPANYALGVRIGSNDRLSQFFSLYEVVRQLIERSVIIIIQGGVCCIGANQDLSGELVVLVESKSRSLTNQNASRS